MLCVLLVLRLPRYMSNILLLSVVLPRSNRHITNSLPVLQQVVVDTPKDHSEASELPRSCRFPTVHSETNSVLVVPGGS